MNSHSRKIVNPKNKVYKCHWQSLAIHTKLLRISLEGLLECSQWECKMFQTNLVPQWNKSESNILVRKFYFTTSL